MLFIICQPVANTVVSRIIAHLESAQISHWKLRRVDVEIALFIVLILNAGFLAENMRN